MIAPLSPGFMVLHSNQLEGLRDLMVGFVQANPLPPLAPEVLLVQSNGMKHWLELALAKDLGVCAATRIELPSTMLWQLYRTVLGPDVVPAQMPLDKSPLVWRLMRRLPALLAQPGYDTLRRYLQPATQDAPDPRRLYQLALQLADAFDGYQNYRADWLEDWARGRDDRVPEAQRWQAALWREVMQDLQSDASGTPAYPSRAQVHATFLDAVQQWPEGQPMPGVPQRLMVFGVTSLPMQTVQALAALGRISQVLMLVQNPCQYHWAHVVESHLALAPLARTRQPHKPGLPQPDTGGGLSDDARFDLHTQTNPLLAAWGKQGRDYLHLLDDLDDVTRYTHLHPRVEMFVDPLAQARSQQREPTQLAQLQSAILNLEAAPDTPHALRDEDDSIQLVQTHSAQREVEVLHDQVLAWLDADPNLASGDIMVMVPDIALFAPHIHAVFGRFQPGEARHVPYAVADSSPRVEPLVQAIEQLLQLPQLRLTQVEWLSWFEVAALRRRFGLDESDVSQLNDWLQQAQVRWGLDATHRQAWGMSTELADAEHNSWLFGLQRLLLGYANGQEAAAQAWHAQLPQPGIGSLDARLVDGLLQWLRHVERALQMLRQEHTPADWVQVLHTLVEMFFDTQDEVDARLIERVLAPLETWLSECQLARLDSPLPLVVVREHWLDQLQQPAMHRRFFGGGVQFATLMPMRAIPFQVVCLLGMNDGDYPRSHTPRDFDLMNDPGQWRPGDRSRREDDRYLFLEALLSARQRLYISWQGRRTTDHAEMPPSVLVRQLMDFLQAGWSHPREAHLQPLQAFSAQYFQAGSGFQTYADDWQRAREARLFSNIATADANKNQANAVASRGAIPASASDATPRHDLNLPQLLRLLRQPVEVFLRERLQLVLDTPEATHPQEEPFGMDGLERYQVTQSIAQADEPEAALDLLRLSGTLALAGFGELQQQRLMQDRDTLLERWQPISNAWPQHLSAQAAQWQLNGRELNATWAQDTEHIWRVREGRWLQVELRPGAVWHGTARKQARVETLPGLWLHHLLACASGNPTTSLQIGLNGLLRFDPIAPETAQDHLSDLMCAYDEAWQRPLPVARKTACAYLQAQDQEPPHNAALPQAQQVFEGNRQLAGEWPQSPALQRVFNGFSDLQDHLPHWADRLYGPMVRAVRLHMEPQAPGDLT